MTDVLSLLPASAFRRANLGKFEAKLDFKERCAILAAYTNGVRRDVLAAAFNVDRRTIGHIVNPTSKHYRDVRVQLEADGVEEFTKKFLTEDIALRLGSVVEAEAKKPPVRADAPDKRANRKQGLHVLKPEQCVHSHRVEIQWREDGEGGWYYRDLDSAEPELWLHNGPDSMRSSQLALSYAERNLMDD